MSQPIKEENSSEPKPPVVLGERRLICGPARITKRHFVSKFLKEINLPALPQPVEMHRKTLDEEREEMLDGEALEDEGEKEVVLNMTRKQQRRFFGAGRERLRRRKMPWILESADGKHVQEGKLEGGITSSYFLFIGVGDDAVMVTPMNGWYNFTEKVGAKPPPAKTKSVPSTSSGADSKDDDQRGTNAEDVENVGKKRVKSYAKFLSRAGLSKEPSDGSKVDVNNLYDGGFKEAADDDDDFGDDDDGEFEEQFSDDDDVEGADDSAHTGKLKNTKLNAEDDSDDDEAEELKLQNAEGAMLGDDGLEGEEDGFEDDFDEMAEYGLGQSRSSTEQIVYVNDYGLDASDEEEERRSPDASAPLAKKRKTES